MRARLLLLAVSSILLGGACQPNPTVFRGSAQFPGGPSACSARCAADGLEMSGFVYSGEFATSCVCRPPGAAAVPPPVASSAPGAPGAPESAEAAGDPLADRGPGDASGAELDSLDSAPVDVAGAQVSVEAAAAAAAAAHARAAQQPLLQHRKP